MRSFPAHRFRRGGFTVFVLAVPVRAVTELLPIPDPDKKFDGNRRVDPAHADAFGQYWASNPRWATPPLLLDTPATLSTGFEPLFQRDSTESGKLTLPDDSAELLEILDGQHRILGWHNAARRIRSGLRAAEREMLTARATDDRLAERRAEAEHLAAATLDARLDSECVTIEIFEGVDLDEHKQFFSDIATNAKGITKSQVAAFDQRDLVNRVAAEVASKHALVEGSVDFEKDRMSGASVNLLSAKTLVDIVRASAIGFESRATQKREALLAADDVRDVTLAFLDILVDEVPGLTEVITGKTSAASLRDRSLIASATVLRCLAGAFRLVAVTGIEQLAPRVDSDGEHQFRGLLRGLADSWGFPVDERWLATGHFQSAASRAPLSRAQDLKGLTLTLAGWASGGIPTRR